MRYGIMGLLRGCGIELLRILAMDTALVQVGLFGRRVVDLCGAGFLARALQWVCLDLGRSVSVGLQDSAELLECGSRVRVFHSLRHRQHWLDQLAGKAIFCRLCDSPDPGVLPVPVGAHLLCGILAGFAVVVGNGNWRCARRLLRRVAAGVVSDSIVLCSAF